MPSADYYKRKCARLTKELDEQRALTERAQELITAIQVRMEDSAALVSITKDGRKIRFLFVRNNVLTTIETMGTWGDDVEGWTKALLR